MKITNLDQIKTITYQKAMNLYLNIPEVSSYLRDMMKGTITGKLQCYHKQNSYHADFLEVIRSFFVSSKA